MRSAIVNYINIGLGNEKSDRLTLSHPIHPHLERAYNHLEPYFKKVIIDDQDVLSTPQHQARFLQYLPLDLRDKVSKEWSNEVGGKLDSAGMWNAWKNNYAVWLNNDSNKYVSIYQAC